MKYINTNYAPQAIGPYSQATKVDNTIFISGQIPLVPDTMEIISDNIEDQTHQVCKNVQNIIESEDLSIENIAKVNIYVKDISKFNTINEIYGNYFSHNPARTCIEISNLPKNAKIEIEAIAYLE